MKFRELFFNKIFTLRNLFFIGNFLALGLFVVVLAQDHFREWKPYQAEYWSKEQDRIKQAMQSGNAESAEALKAELAAAKSHSREIKQILATDFSRVDRCTTCHQGYDSLLNPALSNEFKEHPYAAPKNEIHAKHPFEKYGCTVCHEGQGLATTFKDVGHMPKDENQKAEWKKKYHWETVEFWEQPMKAGPLIYASCSKCHEAHPNVPGMDIVKKGKQVFFENGCIGCHTLHGEGGPISTDLAEETASKPLAQVDFGPAISAGLVDRKERTLENWIRLHFATAPSVLVPGDPHGHYGDPIPPSGMPYFGFSQEEGEALVAYLTSLKIEKVPYTYRVFSPKPAEPVFASPGQHGRYVFQKYGCVSCHGKNGDKPVANYNAVGGQVSNLVKVVGTYTREELAKKIQEGVPIVAKDDPHGPTPPLYMPTWKEKIKGKELENLVTYLLSIAEKQESW